VPDYTDPYLIPYPLADEYGDGSSQIEAMARAIDPLMVAEDARIAALAVRPTLIRRRSADVAWTVGTDLDFNTADHNNAVFTGSVDTYQTPAVGAHAVGGLYPAIWRFEVNTFFIATAPVVGDTRRIEVVVRRFDPATGTTRTWRTFEDNSIEANNGIGGGHYNHLSGCLLLDRPVEFRIDAFWTVAGTFKANSFFSLTRIRSA
jgi:hypothetical protein